MSQQNTDGSYATGSDIALPFTSTTETLRTFSLLDHPQDQAISTARQFVMVDEYNNAEYLARKIITTVDAGQVADDLFGKLNALQNNDGGYGNHAGYQSSVLDTAYALEALALAGRLTSSPAAHAIGFLLSRQSGDGGWDNGDNSSQIFTTALALRSLLYTQGHYPVDAATQSAVSFLISQRDANGSWDEDHLTASVLIGLVNAVADASGISDSAQLLSSHQQANGSWADDVYVTALALRALKLFELRWGSVNAEPGSVDGYVKRASSGEPISNALINVDGVEGASTQSNSSGYFLLSNLRPGDYTIIAGKAGYIDVATAVRVQSNQIAHADDLVLYTEGDTSAPNTVTLQGRVLDGVNNQPIEAATATNLDSGTVVTSDLDGRFTLSGNTSQSFQLELKADGYATRSYLVSAPAWGEMAGTYLLSPSSDDEFATSTTLQGVVADAGTGEPIADATIEIPGTSYSTSSNETGAYELTGIDSLDFQVKVSAFGYEQGEYSVDLEKHGTYTLDAELNPGNSENLFQVISLETLTDPKGANQTHMFKAKVGNLSSVPQQVILSGFVYDPAGDPTNPIAETRPYAPGTQSLESLYAFEPGEVIEVIMPWDTVQFPPRQYRMVLRVIEPGTTLAAPPMGNVLAEGDSYAAITQSQAIFGGVNLDPPVVHVGSTDPVGLEALILNAGNVPLTDTPFTLSIQGEDGTEHHQAQATINTLDVNDNLTVNFGSWIATEPGNLKVLVTAQDGLTEGIIEGTLYVGDKGSGQFTVTPEVVPTGDQTVHATVDVQGINKIFTVDDALALAIHESVRKGGAYLGPTTLQWEDKERCLGCHVQSQAVYGMSAAQTAGVNVNRQQVLGNYNELIDYQRLHLDGSFTFTGGIMAEVLALWALTQWPDKAESFKHKEGAAKFLASRARDKNEPETYWEDSRRDGWWRTNDIMTGVAVLGLVDFIQSANQEVLSQQFDNVTTPYGPAGNFAVNDIEEGPDGALYVSTGRGELLRWDPQEGGVQVLASGMERVSSLAITDDGTAYVGGEFRLYKIPPGGEVEEIIINGMQGIRDVEYGPDGNVYFLTPGSNSRMRYITPSGSIHNFPGANSFLRTPDMFEIDEEGNFFIEDTNNTTKSIIKITPDRQVTHITPRFGGLRGLALLGNGKFLTKKGVYLYEIDEQGSTSNLGQIDFVSEFYVNESGIYSAGNIKTLLRKIEKIPYAFNSSQLDTYRQLISQAAAYLLNTGNTPTDNRIRLAWRLSGLAEARKVVTDPALLSQIETRIDELDSELRSYQLPDGGWGYTSEDTSDALVTAHVGLALEYEEPALTDPVVVNAVQYLLSQQLPDNSWNSANGVMNTNLGATGSVMAYLPRVLQRMGGLDIDLHIDMPSDITLSNPSLSPVSSQANTEGGMDYLWLFDRLDAEGAKIEFDLNLADMQLDEERPAALRAYVTSNNSFNDDQVRVDLDIPVVRADDGLALTVDTDQGMYGANETVVISAPVYNVGPAPQRGQVRFSILSGDDGSVVAQLPVVSFSEIPSGGQTTVTSTWHTGTTVPGDYVVYAELYDRLDRHVDTAEAGFEIRGSEATSTVSLRTTTDKTEYHSTDNADIANLVRNLTSNTSVDNARLKLEVTDPDGNISFSQEVPLDQLSPGASRQVPLTYALHGAAIGDYQVLGRILDSEHTVLAEDDAVFTVQDDPTRSLNGRVDVAIADINQGDTQSCTDTVENRGTQGYANLELRRQVVRLDEEAVALSRIDTVELPAGAELSLVRDFATDIPQGDYTCTLEAYIDGDWHPLAHATFRVKEPPIRIDSEFTLGGQGRVLILLDENTAPGQGQNDPHGPQGAPDLAEQRAFLEELLTARGFAYTIVTTAEAFTSELRSGAYNLYGLFAEHEKLSEQGQKELREAVYRGEGLLVAGRHDKRHNNLDDPLGIKYIGKHPDAIGIEIDPSDWHAGGFESLDIRDKALRAEVQSSVEVGRFATDGSGNPGPNAAVTVHNYGNGMAVYVGYDLLAEAALDQSRDSLHAKLITGALTHVQPVFNNASANTTVPLTLRLTNQGIAVTGQVSFELPDSFEMIDPGLATEDENDIWLWPYSLTEEETEALTVWVRLPAQLGPASIEADIQVDRNDSLVDYDTARLDLLIEDVPGLTEAIERAEQDNKTFKQVIQHLEKAKSWLDKGDIEKSLFELVKAADVLMDIDHPDAHGIRLMTDRAIFETGLLQ